MKNNRRVFQALTMIMQFGINMLVPILLCTFLGVWLGEKTGHPIIMVPLFLMGALAGFRNIFIMAKRIYQPEEKKQTKRDILTPSGNTNIKNKVG